ncbi:unnamed protein product [Closterium sp. Naga37s-1]|nr:unnamed protein product [Closterium sp. Naga37s-1]
MLYYMISSLAGSLAPSVSVGQQHHQRLCAAAPFSPTPTILFPPPPLPLRLQSLVHLRHLSVWGSSITNASAPLLPFPHSHHPLSTPASPPSPAVARSLAPSVSVGQQHHQRLCAAAPFSPTPTILFPPPPLPLPLQSLVHLRHLSVWGSSITNASAPLLPFPPLPPSSFHPRLSPFACSRSFTCAICQCGAAASPTPLRRCSLSPTPTILFPPPPLPLPLQSLVHLHHLSVWGSSITNASAPLLPFPPLPPSSFHPRLSPFACSRSFTCAICQCGAAASPTPLRRCSLSPTPTILFPPPPLPLPLQSLVHLRHLSVWGSSITSASASLLLAFPRLLSANLAWTALSHLPAHPSLTALHLSHCPLLSIGFPLPSSSSSPSASSPSSSHSSSSSSFPLTHLVLSGASIAPPSSLFPPHLLAFLTHLTSTPLLLLSLTPFCYTSPTPFP